jgi:hypothetical protein
MHTNKVGSCQNSEADLSYDTAAFLARMSGIEGTELK